MLPRFRDVCAIVFLHSMVRFDLNQKNPWSRAHHVGCNMRMATAVRASLR